LQSEDKHKEIEGLASCCFVWWVAFMGDGWYICSPDTRYTESEKSEEEKLKREERRTLFEFSHVKIIIAPIG
jgi:hypothetical protein